MSSSKMLEVEHHGVPRLSQESELSGFVTPEEEEKRDHAHDGSVQYYDHREVYDDDVDRQLQQQQQQQQQDEDDNDNDDNDEHGSHRQSTSARRSRIPSPPQQQPLKPPQMQQAEVEAGNVGAGVERDGSLGTRANRVQRNKDTKTTAFFRQNSQQAKSQRVSQASTNNLVPSPTEEQTGGGGAADEAANATAAATAAAVGTAASGQQQDAQPNVFHRTLQKTKLWCARKPPTKSTESAIELQTPVNTMGPKYSDELAEGWCKSVDMTTFTYVNDENVTTVLAFTAHDLLVKTFSTQGTRVKSIPMASVESMEASYERRRSLVQAAWKTAQRFRVALGFLILAVLLFAVCVLGLLGAGYKRPDILAGAAALMFVAFIWSGVLFATELVNLHSRRQSQDRWQVIAFAMALITVTLCFSAFISAAYNLSIVSPVPDSAASNANLFMANLNCAQPPANSVSPIVDDVFCGNVSGFRSSLNAFGILAFVSLLVSVVASIVIACLTPAPRPVIRPNDQRPSCQEVRFGFSAGTSNINAVMGSRTAPFPHVFIDDVRTVLLTWKQRSKVQMARAASL